MKFLLCIHYIYSIFMVVRFISMRGHVSCFNLFIKVFTCIYNSYLLRKTYLLLVRVLTNVCQ